MLYDQKILSWCFQESIEIELDRIQESAKKHISSIFIWPSNSSNLYSNSML